MAVEPLDDEAAAALEAAAAEGNKRATPVTRVRPGHADLAGALKYGFNDVRNVLERASARETAARVAAGGVARAFLRELGIEVWSFTAEVGGVAVDPANCTRSRDEADESPLRCPDPDAEAAMIARIDEARSAGDTVGGVFEVVVHGLPIGLGSYVHWDRRLDAALAAAVMSINIVKGVEFGLGFEQTRRFGSAVHDVIEGRGEGGRWIHRTNNAGGLTGGVTNGEPLVVRGAVKPISTLARPLPSADLITGEAVDKAHYERSDISVVPAAGVVAEAMVMLTLAAAVLEKFGGDTVDDVRAALEHYRARIATAPEAPSPAAAGRPRRRRPAARPDRHGRGRLRRGRLRPPMDVVLVGLPGSGKSVVGRRLAERHAAPFIDLDERIETAAGRSIPEIFADEGEAGFRGLERAAIAALGPADAAPDVRRVIATGGGAVVDPRNRWALYRGRSAVWLDGRPEVLAQRLRRSPNVRPLVTGRDPIGTIRDLAASGSASTPRRPSARRRRRDRRRRRRHREQLAPGRGAGRRDRAAARRDADRADRARRRDRRRGAGGRARPLRARRAILVSEPGAWAAVGERLAAELAAGGREVVHILLPQGEAAKRLAVIETAARELAALRVERCEPLVAIGGGALGDAAGFLAAAYLRGIRFIEVPTTLVAQIDSSIGGKTGVDLPEGKNLVGAFHQPSAIVIDVDLLRTLPERQLRAALGEAVKMAALGDERLFELLESDGAAIARGDPAAFRPGRWPSSSNAAAGRRSRWSSPTSASGRGRRPDHAQPRPFARPRLRGGGGLRRAAPRRGRRLRPARGCRIGLEVGVTPADRAERIGRLLDRLELATEPLPYPLPPSSAIWHGQEACRGPAALVLPTADGVVVRDDIEPARRAGGRELLVDGARRACPSGAPR